MPVADPRAVFLERNAGCIFVYYLFRPIIDCRKHFVETMDQVLAIALESPLPTLSEVETTQPIAPLTSGTGDSPAAHQ